MLMVKIEILLERKSWEHCFINLAIATKPPKKVGIL